VSVLREIVRTPLSAKETQDDKEVLAKRQANAAVALLQLAPNGLLPLDR
jgi:hypothetical protein